MKRQKTEPIYLNLPDIIQNKVKRKASFLELGRLEQRDILDYITDNHLSLRVFGHKWYDVLTKKFYAVEYKPGNFTFVIDKIMLSFNTFEDFYNCVNDDIYHNSCFYGYHFSDEEVSKFKIDISSLNFDAFINENIDLYTFESINSLNKENENTNSDIAKKMVDWIQNHRPVTSYWELENNYNAFTKMFTCYEAKNIFFSMMLRRDKDVAKDFVIQFACKHDFFDGFTFDNVLLTYGEEASLFVINNFDGMCSYNTQRKRVRCFKDSLDGYLSGTLKLERKFGFKESLQLYYVRDIYYNKQNPPLEKCEYFASFDEFTKYVEGNLCGADLSKAKIDRETILKYKTDSKTQFPLSQEYVSYQVKKKYTEEGFIVKQKWYNDNGELILKKRHVFNYFFDFVHFLKGDISGADFLLCDGIENIHSIKGLNIADIKVKSEIAEKLGLPMKILPDDLFGTKEFDTSTKYEIETVDNFMLEHPLDDDYSGKVSYISDIHLLHRFDAYKCKTTDDANYVIRIIAKTIGEQATGVTLIGGDTSSDFNIFDTFISNLSSYRKTGDIFFVLGNHELWGMHGEDLSSIIDKYKSALGEKGKGRMHLVHNNLFYLEDYTWIEITKEDLINLSSDEIRLKTRSAKVIIFGGVGFAGMNEDFNANSGIYEDILDREKEIIQSNLFLMLYEKVTAALKGRNLIVFTHMPMKDWGGIDMHAKEGFVYINGHSHRNYYYDDGKKRIYADNQVGYKGKRLSLKQVSVNFDFDWFQDYKNGIYEISKEDYENFYRGIGEGLTFNRQYEKLFMIKRENTYMFFMETSKGSLLILNGGSIKKAGKHSLDYFYDNLVKYSQSVRLFLSKFDSYQKQISSELKRIGADGTIHGSIIDIDFYNHIYLNPLDGSITPYFANSMVDKYVYDNLQSLLKYQCPNIYQNYLNLIEQKEKTTNALILRDDGFALSKHKIYECSTEMYRVSRILKGLQFTTKYNIVRLWNDSIIADASEDNGRLIVSGIIDPDSMLQQIEEAKPTKTKTKNKH